MNFLALALIVIQINTNNAACLLCKMLLDINVYIILDSVNIIVPHTLE